MPLRLVRCPYCRQRFNVAGAPAGSRIQCTFCAAELRVPVPLRVPTRRSLPRRRRWILSSAAAAALLLAGGTYLLIRPGPPAETGPPVARVPAYEDRVEPAAPETVLRTVGHEPDDVRWNTRVAAVQERLLQEFSAGRLAMMSSYPFLVAVEEGRRFVKTDLVHDYANRLRMLYEQFRREFSGPQDLPKVDEVLPVVILNSRESYDQYCLKTQRRKMPAQITGMYEYAGRRTVMYHDAWAPYEVILHEATHQLAHYYHRRLLEADGRRPGKDVVQSYWFQEGLGTYFEGFRMRDGEIELDPRVNRNRLPAVKQAIEDGSFVPLERLAKMTIDDFWEWFDGGGADESDRSRTAQLYYAESWALVYFLLHGEDGRYKKAFDEYFRCELEGRGTIEALQRALRMETGLSLQRFEEAFVDYVRSLR